MEVYYYCSYTGSPVGFQLGRLDFESGKLSDESIPPLIRRCFSRGIIRKACGLLLDEGKYFVLVKDLTAKKSQAADAEEYYLNIAFVSGVEDYQKWLSDGNMAQQAIADTIRNTISLKGDPVFGFTVHTDQARKLTEISLGSLFKGILPEKDMTYFQVLSPSIRPDELRDVLNLHNDSCTLEKVRAASLQEGNWFRFCKKKARQISNRKLILIPIAALIALAGLFMLLKSLGK